MFGVSHRIHGTGIFTNDAAKTRIGSHANATCPAAHMVVPPQTPGQPIMSEDGLQQRIKEIADAAKEIAKQKS